MGTLSTYRLETPHPPGSVYRLWADPNTWASWDADVEEVRFNDTAVVGATGWMRPSTGPATTFELTALEVDRLVITTSRLPGARLVFDHAVEPVGEGSRVTVTISVEGPMSPLWRLILGKSFVDAANRNVLGLVGYLGAA